MVFSLYVKQRILYYDTCGVKPPTIWKNLSKEGIKSSVYGIFKFIRSYKERGTIVRKTWSGRPFKISQDIKQIVKVQMRADDETTARQLHCLLTNKGYNISLRTILRCRTILGWTFRGSSYCQLIRTANKQKRVEWAVENTNLDFGQTSVLYSWSLTADFVAARKVKLPRISQRRNISESTCVGWNQLKRCHQHLCIRGNNECTNVC